MARQLTFEEREQIAHFRSQGLSRSKIAERLSRHRSTIGRELGRNSDGAIYWASIAQGKTLARRRQRRKKLDDPELNEYVRAGLVKRWSPEQIAGRLRHEHQRKLSHMTIYRWIAADEDRQHWESFLRHGRRRRKPDRRGKLPARVEIAGRPAVVDERSRFGDWEGDTIVGKQRRGGLVTLVERKSGFAMAGKVHRLKSRNVARCVKRRFETLPPALRRTMTLDNGKEFADHVGITRATSLDIYFAEPYHAWQRGSNENFNGLLRQFFPPGTDFTDISPLEVKHVLNLLNDRPRERLGYRTPREILGRHFPVAFQL